jgi:hypothetical protein
MACAHLELVGLLEPMDLNREFEGILSYRQNRCDLIAFHPGERFFKDKRELDKVDSDVIFILENTQENHSEIKYPRA